MRTVSPLRSTSAVVGDQPARGWRWESWLLRALVAASASYALVAGQRDSAVAGAVAFGLTFVPIVVGRRTGAHVPRLVELSFVLATVVVGTSDALGLYDRVEHWGKLVHAVVGACLALLSGLLLLGYRDQVATGFAAKLATLTAMLVGVAFGVGWEVLVFFLDWVRGSAMQTSNTDTMTNFLSMDVAVAVGALLASRAYAHGIGPRQRTELGVLAERLSTPVGRLLERHGTLVSIVVVVLLAVLLGGLWFTGRLVPGLPD